MDWELVGGIAALLAICGGVYGVVRWLGNRQPRSVREMTVPKKLKEELTEAAEKWAEDREGMLFAMAFKVIRFFLGAEWAERKIKLQEKPDPFMFNEFDEESENRFTHMSRVVELAHFLYCLHTSTNFDAMLKRFTERPTKPCFYESEIASRFVEADYEVEIVVETGVKGDDFDFVARKNGCQINVEVTAKDDDTQISVLTIQNTLNDKRKQLPDDNPAVLYVIIPTAWTDNGEVAEAVFTEATDSFFAGSKRINAIVIWWERSFELDEGRVIARAFRPYLHPDPRHQIDDLSFLEPEERYPDLHGLGHILETHSDRDELKNELSQGELAWVPSFARDL